MFRMGFFLFSIVPSLVSCGLKKGPIGTPFGHNLVTLMKKMGIEALYRRPNTSRRHAAHPIYPYLLRERVIEQPNEATRRRAQCRRSCSTGGRGDSRGFAFAVPGAAHVDSRSRATRNNGILRCTYQRS
jgi:hypothetical protein